jgi:phospholipid transport system substrate-binding protein
MTLLKNSVLTIVTTLVVCVATSALAQTTTAPSAAATAAVKTQALGAMSSASLTGDVVKKDAAAKDTLAAKDAAPLAVSPTQAIKDLDAMLDDFKTGKNLSAADEQHNRDLKMNIIHGTFDIRELSKLALANHWPTLTSQQQDHFVDLMVSLLEEKALFSKEQSAAKSKSGGKYKVVYQGHKFLDPAKTRAFVKTKVLVPSENIDINLNYKLKTDNGKWKIFDVIVDEASLVANYKFQFNSIITKNSYDELVNRMQKKLDEIKTNRNKTS